MIRRTNRRGTSILGLAFVALCCANCIGIAFPPPLTATNQEASCGTNLACFSLLGSPAFSASTASGSDSSTSTDATIEPRIHITRVQGSVPFHVYVSAKDSTAADLEHPYDALAYRWNFGDPNGTTMIHPVTGVSVAPNSDQTGPEAAYVYREPGSFEVVLTARRPSGASATERVIVTVDEWTGDTRYFDPVTGDDAADGLSAATPWKSGAKFGEWLREGDNRRALLKRGTVMTLDAALNVATSNIRVEAYGSGAKPILRATTWMSSMLRIVTRDTITDQVYTGIVLDGNSATARTLMSSVMLEAGAELEGLAFVDTDFVNDGGRNLVSMVNHEGLIKNVLFWNAHFERNHSEKNGIYAEMREHFAMIGGSFSGGDGNAQLDHPIYPNQIDHSLFRWIDFQPTFSNNFAINNNTSSGLTLNYLLVDGCDITGGRNGLDFSATAADSWYDNVIVQNNAFHNLGRPSQGYGIIAETLKRITVRNNRFYDNPWEALLIHEHASHQVVLNVYDNIFWKSATNSGPIFSFLPGHQVMLTDNILVNEGLPGGSRNIAVIPADGRSGWVIDRNQYWAPNMTTPFKQDDGTKLNFSDWRGLGFDANGSYSDPAFADPANGDF